MTNQDPSSDDRLSPRAWLEQAIGLHRAAELLFEHWKAVAPIEAAILQQGLQPYLLLSGLALENLFKGAIVGREPAIAAKEPLQWRVGKGGHDLKALYLRERPSLSMRHRARDAG